MIFLRIKIQSIEKTGDSHVLGFCVLDVQTNEEVTDVDIQRLLWTWRDDCLLKRFDVSDTGPYNFIGSFELVDHDLPAIDELVTMALGAEDELP